jgi:hypothetical protein
MTCNLYSAQRRLFNNMLYVRYGHLTKTKPIHKRQTYPLVREDLTMTVTARVQLQKKKKFLVLRSKGLGTKTN